VTAAPAVLATSAGALSVTPLSPEATQGLAELFPRLGTLEHEGRELLALVMRHGPRRMHGLRTGYGHFTGERAVTARRAALFGRMRLPAALAAFRRRGFDGAVLAGACVADNGGGSVQEGELLFVHARKPLADGLPSEPLPAWERLCGPHTTGALLTLITDVDAAWKAGGVGTRTLTDMEPCPADLPQVRWFADVVLVGQRFVLVRPSLDAADPILAALVAAGIGEVEFTPSAFLLHDDPVDGGADGAEQA
jgi:hypothetical protein